MPAEIDESTLPGEAPGPYVLRLAESKARAVAERYTVKHRQAEGTGPGADWVVAADTSVIDPEEQAILGKPVDAADAEAMLRRLRDRTHHVFTGLAVLRLSDGRLLSDLCVTDVTMRAYSDAEMMAYIAGGDPMDKAGAYAIQHAAFHPVASLQGCYANVVGLPLCRLTGLLEAQGAVPPPTEFACLSFYREGCSLTSVCSLPPERLQ